MSGKKEKSMSISLFQIEGNYLIKSNAIDKEFGNQRIKKSKTTRNGTKPKSMRGLKKSVSSSINNYKKVKFNNNIEYIEIECWKIYNLEHTADENYESLFIDFEKEDKQKTNSEDKKDKKRKKDEISCTCQII